MDNIYLLGSIASIASPIGIVFWKIIKKKEMSPFNRYMLIILLLQAILIGVWLLKGEIRSAIISAGICFIFTVLPWLSFYLYDQLLDLIKAQNKLHESQHEINKAQGETNKSQGEIIIEIHQNLGRLTNLFAEYIETTKELITVESVKTERLENELKKLKKKINKKKPTK